MQILRLLAARRRALPIITAAAPECRDGEDDDEGPFFDLDFSACSIRASSSSGSGTLSGSNSDSDDDDRTELDFIISLQRTRSASPQLKFCGSDPPSKAEEAATRKRGIRSLRTLSFGGRRRSFARSSSSSARSLRLFVPSPHPDEEEGEHAEGQSRRAPSRLVIRRYLAKISRRLRGAEARGLRRLRKCRSASSAAPGLRRDDDSALEKQDGIAGAIAHCKESLHRASMSECDDSPLLRSRSDPGECEAACVARAS